MAEIEVKNRFDLWEKLRVISPDEEMEIEVEKILDPDGQQKDSAHGGHYHVRIPMAKNPGEFALLRKRIEEKN